MFCRTGLVPMISRTLLILVFQCCLLKMTLEIWGPGAFSSLNSYEFHVVYICSYTRNLNLFPIICTRLLCILYILLQYKSTEEMVLFNACRSDESDALCEYEKKRIKQKEKNRRVLDEIMEVNNSMWLCVVLLDLPLITFVFYPSNN